MSGARGPGLWRVQGHLSLIQSASSILKNAPLLPMVGCPTLKGRQTPTRPHYEGAPDTDKAHTSHDLAQQQETCRPHVQSNQPIPTWETPMPRFDHSRLTILAREDQGRGGFDGAGRCRLDACLPEIRLGRDSADASCPHVHAASTLHLPPPARPASPVHFRFSARRSSQRPKPADARGRSITASGIWYACIDQSDIGGGGGTVEERHRWSRGDSYTSW